MAGNPERILEIGGVVGFHAPYFIVGEGTFASQEIRDSYDRGVKAVRELQRKLGTALPADLLVGMLSRGPKEMLTIETVYDAGRWGIQLSGFAEPVPTRETLLNACLNDAAWTHKRPLGPMTGSGFTEQSLPIVENDDDVIHNAQGEVIRNENYALPSQDDERVVYMRNILRAPSLLKLERSEDGSVAAQFAFDVGDELARLWCTALKGAARESRILIFPTKENVVSQLPAFSARGNITGTVYFVPSWYQFPPGRKLSSIGAEPKTSR